MLRPVRKAKALEERPSDWAIQQPWVRRWDLAVRRRLEQELVSRVQPQSRSESARVVEARAVVPVGSERASRRRPAPREGQDR